ncbi:MAG: SRPBCC domain-containing protein [Pseudomonadota bacterium]
MNVAKTWQIPFPVEQVYAAWVSSTTVIPPATRMEVEPRVGGHYRLFMETAEFTGRNEGEFLLVEPNARVRYTWEWNNDGEVTTIDVTFAAADAGTQVTQVNLMHTGFTSQASADTHDAGWEAYIEGFIQLLQTS